MKRKNIVIIVVAVVAVLGIGGTVAWNSMPDGATATASGPGHTVPKADLEEAGKEFGRPGSGDTPDKVSCPGGLKAKVEEKVDCTATFGDESKPMEISVGGVEGDEVSLTFGVLEKKA
ncbi:DUF4333 domain-containing protein [Streptomyces daliensis]|uniref:DUF4333 domain-containing protein n=1 Tax=Streptomyces daliensis TaxID=299421 RepID=A0A8T4IUK1_9ACTN|nr:DUF4333 domain-containing protein [Streptomyces daliensis]